MHDAAHWDRRYARADYVFGTEPADVVAAHAPASPPGDALCLGEGEGRNAVWLAQRGHRVTAIDLSARGVEKTHALAAERGVVVHARAGDIHALVWEPESLDLVVMTMVHPTPEERARLHRNIVTALRPGGAYLYEGYLPEQREFRTGGPTDPARLVRADDLRAELAPLEVHTTELVRAQRGRGAPDRQAAVLQVVARRP